jgi:hypothetical protein
MRKAGTAADAFAKELARDSFDATAASSLVTLGGSRWELGKFPTLPSKEGRPEGQSGEAKKSSSSGLSKEGAGALTGQRPTCGTSGGRWRRCGDDDRNSGRCKH